VEIMPVKFSRKIDVKKVGKLYAREKNKKQKARYQALLLLHKYNNNAAEVGRQLGKDRATIGLWVKKYNEEGLAGLHYQKPPGRPSRLTNKQQQEVKRYILRKLPIEIGWEYPVWDGKSLSYLIKKLFGLEFKVRRCQYLFHEMGFSLQRPRHSFAKADKKKQADFKRQVKKNSKTWILRKK